jgi:uncharacterized protein (DUF58 family)
MKRLVPENKLLFAVGLVFLPVSLIVTVMPGYTAGALIIVTGLSILIIADALRAPGQLEGIQVMLPEIVRLSMYRKGEFEIQIINERALKRRIRIGLPFPSEIETPVNDLVAVLPAGTAESSLNWPCRGLRLGDYRMQNCYVEVPSHLGLWAMRTSMPARVEIRVYPNLLRERKGLTSLFLNRGFGIHAQRQVGKGREFEQLREYQNGDSYEDIHWKATARRRQPITKVFQIERTQQIFVVVDSSRLSQRLLKLNSDDERTGTGSQEPPFAAVIDRYISASLLMCMAAERQGDLFGLLTFNDKVNHFIAAKNGKKHFSTCRDALYRLKAKKVTPDFRELFTFISTRVRRRSLLIFLTHLDDPILAEGFCDKIDLISRKHLVLVNMMRPVEARPVFSSEEVSTVDDIYQSLGGHMIWQGLRETEKVLQRRGVGFAMLENESMCPELISQYLALKRRQIL